MLSVFFQTSDRRNEGGGFYHPAVLASPLASLFRNGHTAPTRSSRRNPCSSCRILQKRVPKAYFVKKRSYFLLKTPTRLVIALFEPIASVERQTAALLVWDPKSIKRKRKPVTKRSEERRVGKEC